jgi:(p)ppGpp synthase/HD superfamily hydrolase
MSEENKFSFFARLEPRLAPSELTMIKAAYYLAKFGHRAQVRKEVDSAGEPLRYFEHLRRTAIILMDEANVYEPELICAALLHDTLEDTDDIDAAIIEKIFGSKVTRIVKTLTKIQGAHKDEYVKRLQHSDEDTILIKACDRLDNLRSLNSTSEEFKARKITETIEQFIPIFNNFLYDTERGHHIYQIILHNVKVAS